MTDDCQALLLELRRLKRRIIIGIIALLIFIMYDLFIHENRYAFHAYMLCLFEMIFSNIVLIKKIKIEKTRPVANFLKILFLPLIICFLIPIITQILKIDYSYIFKINCFSLFLIIMISIIQVWIINICVANLSD